jgi:tetratricopeptide (TPR) repeat protein
MIAVGSINDGSELFAQGDYEESWNHTLIALQSRPFNPEALTLLGAIAYMTGNYDVSKELFGVARSLVLNHSEIREIEKSLPAKINRGMLNLPQIGNFKNILRNINNLTVCIIAKNEEKNIERCISSVLPIASQVVVVDTGSTDSTVEIARSLGAEVYFVKWEDDFSAARNAAIRKAKCGWILSIDADEQILPEEHEKLINALNNRCAIAYRLPLVNAGKELEQYCYVPRLFRNAPGIFYKNRIHEQVFPSIINYGKKWGLRICKGNVVITIMDISQN